MFASKYEKTPRRWVCTKHIGNSGCRKKAIVGICTGLRAGHALCAKHRRFPDPKPDQHLLRCSEARRLDSMAIVDGELFDFLFGANSLIHENHGITGEGSEEDASILESMAYSEDSQ